MQTCSLKREMRNLSEECSLEPVTVSMAYVYFEKLVLQGKLNKQNRKLCAGACVLLAAKISSDLRRSEVKQLIDVSTPVLPPLPPPSPASAQPAPPHDPIPPTPRPVPLPPFPGLHPAVPPPGTWNPACAHTQTHCPGWEAEPGPHVTFSLFQHRS